jgi:hypothetical protein
MGGHVYLLWRPVSTFVEITAGPSGGHVARVEFRHRAPIRGTSDPMDRERRSRARALLLTALAAVEEEIAAPRHALCADELGACRDTLRGYLDALDADTLPPRKDRGEGLGRLVQDSWGFEVPLGPLVVQAERAWRTC